MQEEGYALSVVRRDVDGASSRDVEIQRWDINSGEGAVTKEWLGVASKNHGLSSDSIKELKSLGIRKISEDTEIDLPEIVAMLAIKAIRLRDLKGPPSPSSINKRENEERDFVSRLCKVQTKITLWAGAEVYWVLRNPMVLQLDARLRLAESTSIDKDAPIRPQRGLIPPLWTDQ